MAGKNPYYLNKQHSNNILNISISQISYIHVPVYVEVILKFQALFLQVVYINI